MLFKVISACKAVGGKLVVVCKLHLVRQSVEWAVAIGALIAFGILVKPHVRFVEAAVQSAFASPTVGFLLKLIAGVATAGFGILGIGAKTRDDSGRLTKEGTIALTGIVLSAFIGAASSVYDFTSAQRSAADERKKSERLLLSVQRGIYPLRGITGDVAIRFKNDFIGLAKYRSLLRNSLPAASPSPSPGSVSSVVCLRCPSDPCDIGV
jgi:hypothetical protein